MKVFNYFSVSIKSVALISSLFAALTSSAVIIPNTPLVTQVGAKPMVMLVAGKDHKLFYEAYNDTSDIDGDGSLDIGFIPNNPNIIYYGLFDPTVCYTHNNKFNNTGLFTPDSTTITGKCPGKWSGLWLNYMTTSRIDALRKVLYGGYREVDTPTETILRRAYIPQDAHTWGKEYTSEAVNGYKISDYTPFSQPSTGKRHFFGSLTANANTNCSTLSDCSSMPPLLRVRTNVGDNRRVWEWASKERTVLINFLAKTDGSSGTDNFPAGTDAERNYTVRVSVCTGSFINGCKIYPNSTYKPAGLLHEYGENDAMLFGLLSGSYDQHMSGGRLRKVVSSFKDEINASTGQFTANATIVNTFDNLSIRGFNQSSNSSEYWKGNPYQDSAKAPTEGQLVDWGNPIGEMMYEATRYFAGKKKATSVYSTGTTQDTAVGLSTVAWDDPYSSTSAAKAPRCARASFLTISDINPSFDSDQLPGSYFNSFSGDLSGLNVTTEADTITAVESSITGKRFIGQSNTVYDAAPTAKTVTSLGTIRGLAPGEPAKQGSYYSASVAYFAKRTDLRTDLAGKQSIDTFVVALTSPLPQIKVPLLNGRSITLVPFAKSVAGSGISASKGSYQPTNQIVDFYVESIANSGIKDANTSINGGLYYAKFIINYEDVEQGGDHDMDAIAEYEVKANADSTLSVKVTPTYQAGGMVQNMGYAISGTTDDGVYLVAQDETHAQNYFLNVPAGKSPDYCDVATPPAGCSQLPTIGKTAPTFTFTASGTPSATLLKDPLWYAAKWGGFNDTNSNSKPDLKTEWDADGDGVPDTYFLVQNPAKLPQTLKKAFDDIFKTNSSASNVIANSSSVSSTARVFQARFDASYWSGDLVAYPISGSGVATSEEWGAKNKLLNEVGRKLFIRTSASTTTDFSWASLPTADQTTIGSASVLDYLRGVRTKEIQQSGSLRNRSSTVLGDIVHSSPFYVKDSDTIFVGANDGMLHAFKASDGTVAGSAGKELFGFIPAQSVSRLSKLTLPGYVHDYYVDGDVVVSPKSIETNQHNLLFAALGRGGKGLFGLDVTNPDTFGASNFLWEYTPSGSSTAASDADLGYMLGRPTYVKMNNGTGALIVGNGYNSTSGKAVLYIFLLGTNGQITAVKKIDTLAASDNGLATPTGFDEDGNGTIDYIYAGDLKGNVWKFDVSSTSPASWDIATSGLPLFVAKDATGGRQPITAPISIAKDTVVGDTHEGKRFLFFGTGSYFRTTDPADTATQSWYGLIDEGAAITSRTDLKTRTIAASGNFDGKPVRAFSATVPGDMVGKKGWYLDFSLSAGERIVTESILYKLVLPTLIASSIIPASSDPCIPGGTGYINAISPFSGGALTLGTLDVNGNKNYTDDLLGTLLIGSVDLGIGLPSRPTLIGNRLVVGGTSSEVGKRVKDVGVNLGTTPVKGRISWREILKD